MIGDGPLSWTCCECRRLNGPRELSCRNCEKPRWYQLGWTEFERVGYRVIGEVAERIRDGHVN